MEVGVYKSGIYTSVVQWLGHQVVALKIGVQFSVEVPYGPLVEWLKTAVSKTANHGFESRPGLQEDCKTSVHNKKNC